MSLLKYASHFTARTNKLHRDCYTHTYIISFKLESHFIVQNHQQNILFNLFDYEYKATMYISMFFFKFVLR